MMKTDYKLFTLGKSMVFGWFKKKEKELEYDPLNIKLHQLKTGFMLDYGLKTWQVKESYEYDWGQHFFSSEYKLVAADDHFFLSVFEEDDGYEFGLAKKIPVGKLEPDVSTYIINNEEAPQKIVYENQTFYRKCEQAGHYRNVKNEDWDEFISWTFENESGANYIEIEQWDEKEFEASYGTVVDEFDFSNILPGK